MREMKNMAMTGRKKKRRTWDDRIYDFVCNFLLAALVVIIFYPLYFVLVASFTAPEAVNSGRLLLYPVKFTLDGYRMVFRDPEVWIGYMNTILYTVAGTLLGTSIVLMGGYALSRKDLVGRGIIMKLLVFTMYFSGGLIPGFLVVRDLNLINTRAIIIILGSVSVYNMIVVRSFMQSNIPEELFDAATIDGCGNGNFFVRVVLPLSKAVIAVMVLYIAVGYWNSYFTAMIYLTDTAKYPLQLYLRKVLLESSQSAMDKTMLGADMEEVLRLQKMAMVIKYSFIVVATAPILCVYPFVQKYFVKGVMIGSVKG